MEEPHCERSSDGDAVVDGPGPRRGQSPVFVRIDDYVCATRAMRDALDVLLGEGLCVCVAVIPAGLTLAGALLLRHLRDLVGPRLEIAQHGYRHTERRKGSRRFEVGPGMTHREQSSIIASGRMELRRRLGAAEEPIFVPPFNGFDQVTIDVLPAHGMRILSAEDRRLRLRYPLGLCEVSANLDALSGYFPPVLKEPDALLVESDIADARCCYTGLLLHPDLTPLPDSWLRRVVAGLLCGQRRRPITLCGLADGIAAGPTAGAGAHPVSHERGTRL